MLVLSLSHSTCPRLLAAPCRIFRWQIHLVQWGNQLLVVVLVVPAMSTSYLTLSLLTHCIIHFLPRPISITIHIDTIEDISQWCRTLNVCQPSNLSTHLSIFYCQQELHESLIIEFPVVHHLCIIYSSEKQFTIWLPVYWLVVCIHLCSHP